MFQEISDLLSRLTLNLQLIMIPPEIWVVGHSHTKYSHAISIEFSLHLSLN